MSPSDIVGPSPVTSVGTEVTEIEDEISEEVGSQASAANPEPLAKVYRHLHSSTSTFVLIMGTASDAQNQHP